METTHTSNTQPEMRLEWAPYYLQLPRKKTYDEFRCKDCGKPVVWAVSKKTDKTYLAVKATWMSDAHSSSNGRTNQRTFYPAHACEPDTEHQARYALAMQMLDADKSAKLDAGEVVVGAQVEVFKGRKVPKGTAGEVFWVAPQPDAYGVIKAGFKTAEGEKHFTNIENLKSVKAGK
jgi:hypothetical protein